MTKRISIGEDVFIKLSYDSETSENIFTESLGGYYLFEITHDGLLLYQDIGCGYFYDLDEDDSLRIIGVDEL